mmetsp:Transcript_14765/g.39439  ORF Transcript_14765/g.39439 Transcript_14765/m.39439 type:complete len:297 (+) Transcript_14765:415-1305(+)
MYAVNVPSGRRNCVRSERASASCSPSSFGAAAREASSARCARRRASTAARPSALHDATTRTACRRKCFASQPCPFIGQYTRYRPRRASERVSSASERPAAARTSGARHVAQTWCASAQLMLGRSASSSPSSSKQTRHRPRSAGRDGAPPPTCVCDERQRRRAREAAAHASSSSDVGTAGGVGGPSDASERCGPAAVVSVCVAATASAASQSAESRSLPRCCCVALPRCCCAASSSCVHRLWPDSREICSGVKPLNRPAVARARSMPAPLPCRRHSVKTPAWPLYAATIRGVSPATT